MHLHLFTKFQFIIEWCWYMSFLLKSIQKKKGLRKYIGPKRIIFFLGFVAFLIWSWNDYRSGALSPSIIENYRDNHPLGAVALFLSIYAITVIASMPSLPFNLAAGFFWGGILGGIYSAIGVTIGSWIAFVTARLLIGQPLVDKFDIKWASMIQSEFDQGGWKFVAFARINPIIPTGPLNYLLGLTSLSNKDFLWTTFFFLLPPSIAVAYIGDILQTFTGHQAGVNDIIKGILGASAAVTFLFGIRFVSNIFRKRTGE